MNNLKNKSRHHMLRKARVRAIISGTKDRPRLNVQISNRHINAQIIDDGAHRTVASVTTVGSKSATGTMTEQAAWAGTEIAKRAKTAKVSRVVFDRGGHLYHGRVKALADNARAGGLEF